MLGEAGWATFAPWVPPLEQVPDSVGCGHAPRKAGAEQRGARSAQCELRPLCAAARRRGRRCRVGGGAEPAARVLDGWPPPRAHQVATDRVVGGLHRGDAERRKQTRWHGRRARCTHPFGSVGRELRRGVGSHDVPVRCRGDDGAALAARGEVRRGVHATLIPTDHDKVVAGQLCPAPNARVVLAKLRARERWRSSGSRVLELPRSPDYEAASD
mmetsp:Transcript_132377/g.369021  ORF Transcript_132377/g.369021 Transcript_132377/m.369021 type:complete len:214 (-) Transcript_132377:1050-1691(-)